jgi:hypothetical protein
MKRLTDCLLRMLINAVYILPVMHVSAQNNILLKGDTLILNNQAKFWINEEVKFGSGTMPDKTYSYIYEAPNSLQKLININTRRRKLLSSGYKGYKSKIVKFEKEIGHNKKDYNYNILVLEMPDGKRYWCDVVNAFNNHEIQLNAPENNIVQVTKTESNNDPEDVNAELKKLKQLLDNGSISQQEYDIRKKKILDSQKVTSKHPKTLKSKPVSVF